MKKLTLIRHGKSSWVDTSLSDWARPLKNRGKKDAKLIGDKLAMDGIIPDQMISSSAYRAHETAKRITECIKYPESDITITDDIYHAAMAQLVQLIKNLNNEWDHVFLFGHNPYFTEIANIYCTEELLNLPTTGVFQITFDCDKWADISTNNGKNTYFLIPKELKI